ncbi:MAG: DUF2807 domain-containing protein [Gemmatimonadaceae bacterium]|nr:DUF2807 domain-containing protein [Chitinophagaceae bacterium]
MKKLITGVLAMLFVAAGFSQQTIVNDPNVEKRNVEGSFDVITISNAIDLYLSQGNEEAVAVSASDTKYRDRIRAEVKNGTLKIWFEHENGWKWNEGNKKMKAYVSVKNLKKLSSSGASDVFVNGTLRVPELAVALSGASDFKGAVDTRNLAVHISGASDMTVSGSATNVIVDASGASDFKGYDLVSQTCDAEASGASDIKITVNTELTASASGASDIRMKGSGVIRKGNSSGASSVKKI